MYDSCQILRAALLAPGGIGLTVVDLEDHLALQMQPEVAFRDIERCFLPFNECNPAERALIFPQVPGLMQNLCRIVLPCSREF